MSNIVNNVPAPAQPKSLFFGVMTILVVVMAIAFPYIPCIDIPHIASAVTATILFIKENDVILKQLVIPLLDRFSRSEKYFILFILTGFMFALYWFGHAGIPVMFAMGLLINKVYHLLKDDDEREAAIEELAIAQRNHDERIQQDQVEIARLIAIRDALPDP